MLYLKIKKWCQAVILAVSVGGAFIGLTAPVTASATGSTSCNSGFLTFPAWYDGLTNSDCSLQTPGTGKGQVSLSDYIWHIVLNCIDIGLQIVGYISAIFILYGGFLFLTSSGSQTGIANAKNTILNAVIGLVISIASVAIINIIVGIIS